MMASSCNFFCWGMYIVFANLSSQDDIVVKKTLEDGHNSIMVPLHSFLVPEKNNEGKILQVTQKIIDILSREVPIRCQDVSTQCKNWSKINVSIKEDIKGEEESVIKERQCLGHKDLYKDIKMENQPPLTSPDGSSHGNPPERSPRPLYSQDFTQKGHTIPHHHQVDGSSNGNPPERGPRPLYSRDSTQEDHIIRHHHQGEEVMGIKIEVKEEDEMYVTDNQLSLNEDELMMTMTKEESSLDVSTGGHRSWNIRGRRLILSADYNKEDNDVVQYSPRKRIVTKNLHHKLNPMVRSTNRFAFENSKNKLHTDIPDVHTSYDSADPSLDPSNLEESSPNILHPDQNCEQSFIQSHDLDVQQRIPTSRNPFYCSQCEKSFLRKSGLVQHLRIHIGEKPFSCSVCGKSFFEKSQLNRHHIVHTGEKPFPCPQCGKCFSHKGNRDKHMRVHTGEKPFSCVECGKCFAQKSTLIIHQKMHTT